MKRYLLLSILSLFLLAGLFFYQNARLTDGRLHIVFCNVGQGDAIFIKTPGGKDVLVDGGPNDKVMECLFKNMPFWDRTIDLVVLTHPDADHITGFVDVLERYIVLHFVTSKTTKNTAIYKKFLKALDDEGLSLKYVFANDKINFGDGVVANIVWPSVESLTNQNIKESEMNEYSVIQVVSYGAFDALLTGDAGSSIEDKIAGDAGQIEVLKVPHHGSKTGMSGYFLSSITPELAIISVGANNRYGHPAKTSLDLLKSHNIKTLRTDKNGEVEIITDGKTYGVRVN